MVGKSSAPTPDTSLGCEYCSGENDKPGWKGSYSDDGAIGYVACWNCNPNGLPSSADTSPGDEIEEILDHLQARDFYDAVQVIEGLGASVDFTNSVNAVWAVGRQYGSRISSREEAKDRLNRLMLTRTRAELLSVKAKLLVDQDAMIPNATIRVILNKSLAAIDAQLNKEEK